MALYTVATNATSAALDVNQYSQLLTGTMTDQQVTIANRVRAQFTGATTASGYVGGVSGAAPTSGTFAAGDMAVDQKGPLWVCTAGGSPGTWQATPTQIGTQKLGASAASVTFSSVPTTFNHLLLACFARSDSVATDVNLQLRLNGDAASNYQYSFAEFTPGLADGDFYGQTFIQIGKPPAASATSKMFGASWTLISGGAVGGSAFVSTATMAFRPSGSSAGTNKLCLYGGTYRSSAAVTSVTVMSGAGSFIANSTFSLYGLM